MYCCSVTLAVTRAGIHSVAKKASKTLRVLPLSLIRSQVIHAHGCMAYHNFCELFFCFVHAGYIIKSDGLRGARVLLMPPACAVLRKLQWELVECSQQETDVHDIHLQVKGVTGLSRGRQGLAGGVKGVSRGCQGSVKGFKRVSAGRQRGLKGLTGESSTYHGLIKGSSKGVSRVVKGAGGQGLVEGVSRGF